MCTAEIKVNLSNTGNQNRPDVATFSDGKFIVVWSTTDHHQYKCTICAQRYDQFGNKIKSEWMVGDASKAITDLHRTRVRIAILTDGRFAIVWNQYADSNYNSYVVKAHIYKTQGDDSDVSEEGAQITVNTHAAIWGSPDIAPLDNGGFVITWTSQGQDGDSLGVYMKIFNSSGSVVGSETKVNRYTTSDQMWSSVARLTNGSFVIAWQSKEQDGNDYGTYVQRFDSSGNFLGSETQVNTHTTYGFQGIPNISGLSNGGFVIVFHGVGNNCQIYDSSGNPQGSNFRVGDSYNEVVGLPTGGFVVTWHNYSGDGDGSMKGIFAKKFDLVNGISETATVNTYTTNDQSYPTIAAFYNGGYVITYMSVNPMQDNDQASISATRFDQANSKINVGTRLKNSPTATTFSQVLNTKSGLVDFASHNYDSNLKIMLITLPRKGYITVQNAATVVDTAFVMNDITYNSNDSECATGHFDSFDYKVYDSDNKFNSTVATVNIQGAAFYCPAEKTETSPIVYVLIGVGANCGILLIAFLVWICCVKWCCCCCKKNSGVVHVDQRQYAKPMNHSS